jgi:hypothetical protein
MGPGGETHSFADEGVRGPNSDDYELRLCRKNKGPGPIGFRHTEEAYPLTCFSPSRDPEESKYAFAEQMMFGIQHHRLNAHLCLSIHLCVPNPRNLKFKICRWGAKEVLD